MAREMKTSIIIPAYNEEIVLEENLRKVTNSFPEAEIILVDDGSRDKTGKIAKKFTQVTYLKNEKNCGKGSALKRGMMKASGELLIFTDADLPFGIAGIETIIKTFEKNPKADIVVAEKKGYKKSVLYKALRKVVRGVIKISFSLSFHDSQAGLKGFTKESAQKIFPQAFVAGFASDVEALFLAQKQGLKIESIPLKVIDHAGRVSKFNLKEGFLFIIDLLKIRLHNYKDAKIALCKQESEEA